MVVSGFRDVHLAFMAHSEQPAEPEELPQCHNRERIEDFLHELAREFIEIGE